MENRQWYYRDSNGTWTEVTWVDLQRCCTGSAGNGESPLPNKTLERAWFRYSEPCLLGHLWSPWLCQAVRQTPPLSRCRELTFALGKDEELATFKLVFGRHVADGPVQALLIMFITNRLTNRRASVRESGVPGRMHSPFSDLCQRSIFPLLCG